MKTYSIYLTTVAEVRDVGKRTVEEAHQLLVTLSAVEIFGSVAAVQRARAVQSALGEVLFPDQSDYVDPRAHVFMIEDELINQIRTDLELELLPIREGRRDRALARKPGE